MHEIIIRVSCFIGVLIAMMVWEWCAPVRQLTVVKSKRWVSNLAIAGVNSILVRILFPMAAVGAALYAQQKHIGLFNLIPMSYWLQVVISVVLLDLVIYLQHVMFHFIPVLWRIHRMHHLDLDIDVTTGVRFHPFEIILSLFIKFAAVLLLGAPVTAVIIFEVLLNAITLFNHSNVYMPVVIEQVIRSLIVTPYMHRVHHSDIPNETNSNFGFNLSLWDRIFGTYRASPQLGHEHMVIGIKAMGDHAYCVQLLGMMWSPFIR